MFPGRQVELIRDVLDSPSQSFQPRPSPSRPGRFKSRPDPESGDQCCGVSALEFWNWSAVQGPRYAVIGAGVAAGGLRGAPPAPCLGCTALKIEHGSDDKGVKPAEGVWLRGMGYQGIDVDGVHQNPAGREPCCGLVCITPSSRTWRHAGTLFTILSPISGGLDLVQGQSGYHPDNLRCESGSQTQRSRSRSRPPGQLGYCNLPRYIHGPPKRTKRRCSAQTNRSHVGRHPTRSNRSKIKPSGKNNRR